jgi:hypothetical protein
MPPLACVCKLVVVVVEGKRLVHPVLRVFYQQTHTDCTCCCCAIVLWISTK